MALSEWRNCRAGTVQLAHINYPLLLPTHRLFLAEFWVSRHFVIGISAARQPVRPVTMAEARNYPTS